MLNKRSTVYRRFPEYIQKKDTRSMDEICNASGEFALQTQQRFLVDYMRKNPNWRSLLLYHALGSGKTCTSISMAEEYLKENPSHKVTVILPARLRTNFFDELISPCGMNTYISKEEFYTYHDRSTSDSMKKRIRKKFMDAIQERYEIMSFEKFKKQATTYGSLEEWVLELTKNRMIIIDEVHNLLNNIYEREKLEYALKNHILPTGKKMKGVFTILFRYLCKNAHPSAKLVFMTATPIFDNVAQLKELIGGLNPDIDTKKPMKLSDAINALRGKVSFFPGISASAYPSSSFNVHEIPLSPLQDKLTQDVIDENEDDMNEDKEAFMAKQRQISLACFNNMKLLSKNIDKIVGDLPRYAPKIGKLIKELKRPGKHVIYSNFIKSGLNIVIAALEKAGWVNWATKGDKKGDYKTFALWDGSVKDTDKQMIKSVVNAKDNIDGKMIKVILGSPSVKEGVSFKHVQCLHLLDPMWNQSSKSQVEGRAIRFCSHIDIDEKLHAPLKRHVEINIYKSVNNPRGTVAETCDMLIYDNIIPRKFEFVKKAEDALQRVALDYHLFRKLYRESPQASPGSTESQSTSPVNLPEDFRLVKNKIMRKVKNTCPKKKRPNLEGNCPSGQEARPNKYGDICCFKMKRERRVKAINGCAIERLPLNGKCPTGFVLKNNKQGQECCFKKRSSKKDKKEDETVNKPKISLKMKPKAD